MLALRALIAISCVVGGRGSSAPAVSCHKEGGEGSCAANADSGVAKAPDVSARADFWARAKHSGLKVQLRRKTVAEKAQAGRAARNRTSMTLSDDVFYGRAIMKIPRFMLLSIESTPDMDLRRELTRFLFDDKVLEKKHNITGEEPTHLLSLAYPLISENRDRDSVFREWLDAAQDVQLPVLTLSERQLRVLKGTTVEGAYAEMVGNRNLIEQTASNLTYFKKWPITGQEAAWALAVIMRHARVVHPHQDVRDTRDARMYLVPIVDLLDVQLHPDSNTAISFQEEIILEDGKREEEMVLQIARRDMPKGDEVFFWPGRLSNSEMIVRHGIAFPLNHVGIGRNITQPPNWSPNAEGKIRKEYAEYNCSTLEAFELRFSPKGVPMQNFVRCYRVSWFLTNGWYSPAYKNRLRELNKWPPPKKYDKHDWLSWTQADAELNRVIKEYCNMMRDQLKDTMDAEIADDFRKSKDPMDRLLWHLRGEESKTFKECLALAKSIVTP